MAKKEIEKMTDKDTGAEEADASSKGGKNKILIIFIALLLLAGAGAGLYFSGMLPFGKLESTQADKKEDVHGSETAAKENVHGEKSEAGHGEGGTAKPAGAPSNGPIYFNFPETSKFVVNLNTGGKQASFLKVDVSLELPTQQDLEAVNANLPRIQDMFNTYLRELRPSDLQGSAGVYRLKEELLLRVNKAVAPAKVTDVLFKEIIVQ